MSFDEVSCLRFARELVAAKITNQRTILRRNWRGEPEARQAVLDRLRAAQRSAGKAGTLTELLGMEGDAATTYFRAFSGLLKQPDTDGELAPFRFEVRNRRPPTDPVNAMLSFAYAMLTRHLTIAVASVGLDPYRGFYHAPRYGRPALALDVMEPFRSLIADSVVLPAINTGEVGPNDFVVAVTGTALTQAGRRRFVEAFERRLSQETTHPVFGYQVSMRSMRGAWSRPRPPAGSSFKGYEDYLVQDLVCRPYNVLLRRERWLTPEGAYVVAPLPAGTRGHFGAELRRFVLAQYHGAQTSVERLTRLLRDLGVDISKRQIMRLLNQGQEDFVAESQAVLRAGLEGAPWISVDDTGARHGDRNGVTTQIGNDAFAWFGTTFSKSRLNFLELLRAGHGDYVLNAAAFAYMHKRNLAGPVIARLAEAPGNGCKSRRFASEGAWMAHLEQLGITALNVHPEPVRIATEGALWGAIQAHGLLADTVILSDDAGQFNVGRHALCWVHAERLIHKLDAFTDHQRREKERIQARLWSLYAALKAYRRKPSKRLGGQLARRFDALFTSKTGFITLDRLLARIHANRLELLVVLDRPEVPLNTNGSENDIRAMVTRRKLSAGTRSQSGKQARDTFIGLMKTCRKLGISYWHYLGDRLQVPNATPVPSLPGLVRQRCMEMA